MRAWHTDTFWCMTTEPGGAPMTRAIVSRRSAASPPALGPGPHAAGGPGVRVVLQLRATAAGHRPERVAHQVGGLSRMGNSARQRGAASARAPPCGAPGSTGAGPAGVARRAARHLLGRALRHHAPAPGPRLGAEVDHVVGALDDVQVVLDHDHGVARVHQPAQHVRAACARRRSAGRWWARRGCRACGRCRAGPARAPASRAAPRRPRAWSRSGPAAGSRGPRPSACSSRRSGAGAVEHACASATVMSSTSAMVRPGRGSRASRGCSGGPAGLAGHVDVRQEVHLDRAHAVALAGLAAAALHVEREAARLVAARPRLGHQAEQLADEGEGARVGGGVAARRAADGALVDGDDLVELPRRPPARGACRARRPRRAAGGPARGSRMSSTSVDLPEPLTRR